MKVSNKQQIQVKKHSKTWDVPEYIREPSGQGKLES